MDNYIVSARKYRPTIFKDVVGQDHITTTLKNAIRKKQLAQAFLFCGPRGIGKTTCARILAKTINCENVSSDIEACGECNSCKSFQESTSFNVHELDGASNNSVDDMRALIEQVRYMPQAGKFKIYIIDEVHMLSSAAFNAFLKTLEEPPPFAIFILATTEKHKILPTILSRCQIFDFNRIGVKDIASHLETICIKEKIDFEQDALHVIAQKADGALRDSLSILDRTVSFSEGKLKYKEVLEHLNILDYDYYFKITDQLLAEDSASVLNSFNEVLAKGFEGDTFLEGISQHFRDLLVSKDPETISLLEVSEGLGNRYREQATYAPAQFLLSGLNIANQFEINYKASKNKRLHVELALLKLAYLNHILKLENIPADAKKKPEKYQQELTKEAPSPKEYKTESNSKPATIEEEKRGAEVPPEEKLIETDQEAVPSTKPLKSENPSKSISGINLGSLEDIYQSLDSESEKNLDIDKQEETPEVDRQVNINQEALLVAWQRVAESLYKKNNASTAALVSNYKPTSKHNQIILKVLSSVEKSILISAAADICLVLREEFTQPDIFLLVEIENDPSKKFTARKPYTADEKYEYLKEKNPVLEELKKGLDLELDF